MSGYVPGKLCMKNLTYTNRVVDIVQSLISLQPQSQTLQKIEVFKYLHRNMSKHNDRSYLQQTFDVVYSILYSRLPNVLLKLDSVL